VILFDTNVLIYAFDPASPQHVWARKLLFGSIQGKGAVVNPVILAEICVGDTFPETVVERVEKLGIRVIDLKPEVSLRCARTFSEYLARSKSAGESAAARVPLPDFFIGAQASLLNLPIATVDTARYQTYFPEVELITPPPKSQRENKL